VLDLELAEEIFARVAPHDTFHRDSNATVVNPYLRWIYLNVLAQEFANSGGNMKAGVHVPGAAHSIAQQREQTQWVQLQLDTRSCFAPCSEVVRLERY
jgi:hypothetical protein